MATAVVTSRACERSGSGRISVHCSNLFLWLPIPAPRPPVPAPLPLQPICFTSAHQILGPLRSSSTPAPICFKQQTEKVGRFLPRQQLC